jgi:predicted nucleic acid-binding protein
MAKVSNRKPPKRAAAEASDATPVVDWAALPDGALLLVDSAPLIYHFEDNAQFAHRFAGLFEAATAGRVAIAITTITLAEVLTGPYKHGRDALAKQIEAALNEHGICPLSTSIAIDAARLRQHYRLRLPDAIQLATALQINAFALVTHDRDFSSVQDIRVLM